MLGDLSDILASLLNPPPVNSSWKTVGPGGTIKDVKEEKEGRVPRIFSHAKKGRKGSAWVLHHTSGSHTSSRRSSHKYCKDSTRFGSYTDLIQCLFLNPTPLSVISNQRWVHFIPYTLIWVGDTTLPLAALCASQDAEIALPQAKD